MGIEIVFRVRNSEELEQGFDACRSQNAAGAETGAFRHTGDLGFHPEAAAEAREHLFQTSARGRDHTACQKSCLLQNKGIKRVADTLERFNGREFSVNIHIPAVKDDLRFVQTFQRHLYGPFPIEKDGRIENRTAVFVAVGRCIRPAAAPVDAQRQGDGMFVLRDAGLL